MYSTEPRKQILIVEDEAFVAEVVKCALEDRHEIDWAADVPGAVGAMIADPPDLVILDCLLPGGSLSELLARADLLGAPVVMMSGHADMLGQFLAFGYPCLHKPFGLDDLLQTVDRSLQGRWAELHAS